MSDYFIKKPCIHCPFRNDVKPFLRPERGAELAIHASNPYNSFTCHKTTEPDEESDSGEMLLNDNSKECAGFLTLQIQEGAKIPYGFNPSYDIVYQDIYDMIDAYENQD